MRPSFSEIKEQVKQVDPTIDLRTVNGRRAALLLSSSVVGTDCRKLISYTGYAPHTVWSFAEQATAVGLWKDGKVVHSGWDDEKAGGIAFLIDLGVLQGLLERTANPI